MPNSRLPTAGRGRFADRLDGSIMGHDNRCILLRGRNFPLRRSPDARLHGMIQCRIRNSFPTTMLMLAAALLMVAAGCREGNGKPLPNGRDVVLITVDTLRHDATGFSGAGQGYSPWADRLAASGRVFDFAHAHAVVTLPSHASILTGLYPYQHQVRDNAGFVLSNEFPTLATILTGEGYATGGFVSSFTLDRRFGIGNGFQEYDDRYDGYGGPGFTPPERPGDVTVEAALEWWDSHRGEKRFLWVHLFTPHFPYEPSDEFAKRFPDRPYYGDAAMADGQLAPLIERLLDNEDRDAVVVYTSDHGEGLGEHGEISHGLFAYESTLRIPLVIRAESLLEIGIDRLPARHVDIVPTVLDLLGVPVPQGLPGRSLRTQPDGDLEPVGSYFEALSPWLNRGWAPLAGGMEGMEKAIRLPLAELYDLQADPEEKNNLAGDRGGRLRDLLRAVPEPALGNVGRDEIDRETEARLRSLGYVATGGEGRDVPFTPENDPKNLVRFDAMLDQALGAYRTGDVSSAIGTLRRLIQEQPAMTLAYSHLAFFYSDLGRLDDANKVLEAALNEGVAGESLARRYALNLVRGGRPQEASEVLAIFDESMDPETQSALGRIAAMTGKFEEARGRFMKALQIDPTFPTARMDLGILLLSQERFGEAEEVLATALQQDPYLAEAWNGLGVIRSQKNDLSGAMEAWRKALKIDPRLADGWYNLALAASRLGDRATALDSMEQYVSLVEGQERQQAEAILSRIRAGN